MTEHGRGPWPSRPWACARGLRLAARGVVAGLALLAGGWGQAADEPQPARLNISGYGFLGNREVRRMVLLPEKGRRPPAFYDANFVEDAALLITARLVRDGYLKPRLTVSLRLADGTTLTQSWQDETLPQWPRSMAVQEANFQIKRGELYYYDQVTFSGLTALSDGKARQFFFNGEGLISPKASRIYTPSLLRQSIEGLAAALDSKGYGEAKVVIDQLIVNDADGSVRVSLAVDQGPVALVRSVTTQMAAAEEATSVPAEPVAPGTVYSQGWARNFAQQLQVSQYLLGYPDASVRLTERRRDTADDRSQLDLLAIVERGPRVEVGRLKFAGNEHTQEAALRRRVQVEEGEPLNRVEVEQARYRLSRLAIFDSVRVRYEEVDEQTRDVIYDLEESKRSEISLLGGYGSYELLRGGVEWQQRNLLGRAHTSRLRLIQSFKATSADYAYTVPELFSQDLDAFVTGSGLQREEPSFQREEYGGGAGIRRRFPSIATDASLRYNYEFLNARDPDLVLPDAVRRSQVSSFVSDFKHDRRDNPLYPRSGYHVFTTLELASAALGGQTDFQRVELSGSWHLPLGGGRLLHLGLSHGADLSLGGSRDELPFNKRFFPGGENSVRGYKEGEAGPRDAQGQFVGAETFLEGHGELEQSLTPSWSLVAFLDGVGFARDLGDYPADTALYSAGGGVRWKTLIGPVRLEYGHNLNPRSGDPDGTFHFSIGFPF